MEFVMIAEDLSEMPKHFAELKGLFCMASGFDFPRYVDQSTYRCAKLGLYPWTEHQYRPTGTAVAGGSLTDTKWFSVRVDAVDSRFADAVGSRCSIPGPISDAVQAATPNLSIEWALPAHPDTGTEPDGVGGLTTTDECESRRVYVCQADTEAEALLGPWTYAGVVSNNTGAAVYTLSSFATGSSSPDSDAYPPINGKLCMQAYDRLVVAGGISESRGQVQVKTGTEAETVTDVALADAQTDTWKYTFSAAPTLPIYKGSLLSVVDCAQAGNNVTDAVVTRVAGDQTWVEIVNASGVVETPPGAATGTVQQNHVVGTGTYFTAGMLEMSFRFSASLEPTYLISEVDVTNQILGLTTEYAGGIAANTDTDYEVFSAPGVAWSSVFNPHHFPVENWMQLPANVTAMIAFYDRMLFWTEDSCYVVLKDAFDQGYREMQDALGCISPASIVISGEAVYFWSGKGIAKTDGVRCVTVALYRAQDYLADLAMDKIENITGVYDAAANRLRWSFSKDSEACNNWGLELIPQTEDISFTRHLDRALYWTGFDPDTRKRNVWWGSSGRYTDSGKCYLFTLDEDLSEDALPALSGYRARVHDVSDLASNFIKVIPEDDTFTYHTIDAVSTKNENVPFTILDDQDQFEVHGIVKKITDSAGVFSVYFHADFDLSLVAENDIFMLGCIPAYYGPKWTDFDSPRFLHQVYDLHLEFHPLSEDARIYIDWFKDMDGDNAVQTDYIDVDAGESGLVCEFKQGKCRSLGFRVRWYGPGQLRLQHYTLTWATIR